MTFSFNLIDQKWIPCITQEGKLEEFSLNGFFEQAHELQEICCETPVMTAAIYPMVLALLHRVFGPEDDEEWEILWKYGRFQMDRINVYLEQWYDRFDLFHSEYPFYQISDDRVEPKSILYIAESIANTGTLFTHVTEETTSGISPAEATRLLLVAQTFRLAGGVSGKLSPNFVDSIWSKGVLFFAKGQNLFETFMLNLFSYPDETITNTTANDHPFWENEILSTRYKHSKKIDEIAPKGYLDYLTWQTNNIQLFPEETVDGVIVRDMTLAPSKKISESTFSPQKQYEKVEKKDEVSYQLLRFNQDKSLWRDYHILLSLDNDNLKSPAVIGWLSMLALHGAIDNTYRPKLMAIGMLADRAKPIFYRQEVMPLSLEILRKQTDIQTVAKAIQDAESINQQLFTALKELADQVLMRGATGKPDGEQRNNLILQWNVNSLYWIELESHFWQLIEELTQDNPDASDNWQTTLQTTAVNALDQAIQMAGQTPWAMKGGIIARRKLYAGFNKVFKSEE